MKKTLILLIAITLSTLVMAQEKTKVKEVGLTFRNLDEFGFSYKIGTEQSLWRFNAISISGGNVDAEFNNDDNNRFGLSFKAGKEYRKLISEKIEFRYGADLSFGYHYSKNTDYDTEYGSYHEEKENRYSPGINFVLGLNYKINEQFIFGAEVMPYLNYSISKSTSSTNTYGKNKSEYSNFNYGFSSSSVLLSLAYRI